MEKPPSPLGLRVARLRKAAGIGARPLSLAIGATHSVIDQLEKGRIADLRAGLLLPLARALGTSMEFLLIGEGQEPSPEDIQAAFLAARLAAKETAEATA